MSKSTGRPDLDDVVAAKALPHHEIVLPTAEIAGSSHTAANYPNACHSGDTGRGAQGAEQGVAEELSHYEHIDIPMETQLESSTERNPQSPYHVKATEGKQMLMQFRDVTTRQCKFEIGEEWELFQTNQNQSVSCPPSPAAAKNKLHTQAADNRAYEASEPGSDPDKGETNEPQKNKEPFPFHLLFSDPPSREKERHIVPNPYNNLNQRFHSGLQCPCFLFFFFLCCIPAVLYMQWSDLQFKKGDKERAKHYGKLSTALYIVGFIIGVAFLSVCIYFAADYVRQFVR